MDSDEFAAFLAGAVMACFLVVAYQLTRPPRTSTAYIPRSVFPPPAHCWACEAEARELEQFGHTHMPVKRTPSIAPAPRGK
jgi:hypothetical protein